MTDPPSPEEVKGAYSVDDLVSDERRHFKFMVLIFVLAAIYFAVYGRPEGLTPRPDAPGASGR